MSLLTDLRVVDLTDPFGVFATRLLADLGADVSASNPLTAARGGVELTDGAAPGRVMAQIAASAPLDEVMALIQRLDLVGLPVGRFEDFVAHPRFAATRQFAEVRSPSLEPFPPTMDQDVSVGG